MQAQWRLRTAKKRQMQQERTAIETLIAIQPSNQQVRRAPYCFAQTDLEILSPLTQVIAI
jgi:hypothetical protein